MALVYEKYKVVEFLLENGFVDIITCCKRTPLSINNDDPRNLSLLRLKSKSVYTSSQQSQSKQFIHRRSSIANLLEITNNNSSIGGESTQHNSSSFSNSFSHNNSPFSSKPQSTSDSLPKDLLPLVPFLTLINKRNKELFLRFWEIFRFQMSYDHFKKIY